MSKINLIIFLLVSFILYKGYKLNKTIEVSKSKNSRSLKVEKISPQASKNNSSTVKEHHLNPGPIKNTPSTEDKSSIDNLSQTQADYDSLNELQAAHHVEAISAEAAAVPSEKLSESENEQYLISLSEQKIVSETGTAQSEPEKNKEGEP